MANNIYNMDVISPLCEEHIYTINLAEITSDDLIISVNDFLNKEYTTKTLLNFIKSVNDPQIFDILICKMPYTTWIKMFKDVSILKYYWSKSLILKIIDSNRIAINLCILNNESYEKHVIKLNEQYDVNYNFRKQVIEKRIKLIEPILKRIDNTLQFNMFYGGGDVIKHIGLNKNDIKNVVFTFYPKNKINICINKNILHKNDDDFLTVYINDDNKHILIKFAKKIHDIKSVLSLDVGIIDNDKILATAELYQSFEKKIANKIHSETNMIKADKNVYISFTHKHEIKQIPYTKCYACKQLYEGIKLSEYVHYCIECGINHYRKRREKADLTNFTVFITGIRVKIGFETALRVLRSGGTVIGTTRYPNFAIYNFSNEKDYDAWKERIIIIKCDFTNINSVYRLIKLVKTYKINALVNNAFRHIRPSEFYDNAVKQIERTFSEKLAINYPCENKIEKYGVKDEYYLDLRNISEKELKQVKIDAHINKFHDITDIPHKNSWNQKIEEIDPTEITECMAINQLVPTLLINSLKPILVAPKFIIHVASLEGQFNNIGKTSHHVHTNMCKSAMNMLIRTLAEENDKDLHVHAIDPGYVSGVCPQKESYPVPLEDSAAKILYPITRYYNGVPLDKDMIKLRNYEKSPW